MICLVTDRRRLSPDGGASARGLIDLVRAAASAGIDIIQIRELDLAARELAALVTACVAVARGTPARIVVNDRADVAIAAGAHGVHLRGDSMSPVHARRLLPEGAAVGRSVHSPDQAHAVAREGGVDYLIFGTLFPTESKPSHARIATLDELTAASRAARAFGIPLLAIGGITVDNARQAAVAGAAGVAGIGLFVPPANVAVHQHVAGVAAALRRTFDTCGAVP